MRVTGGLLILGIALLALAAVVDHFVDNVAQIPGAIGVACVFGANVTGLVLGPKTARWAATFWWIAVALVFRLLLQTQSTGPRPGGHLAEGPSTDDILNIITVTFCLLSFALHGLAIIQAVQDSRARRAFPAGSG